VIKVSIIINTYNRAKYLSNTLSVLKKQDYKDFEIIIVNGPSSDSTEYICKRYAESNSSIHYYRIDDANLSKSRNFGLKKAIGLFVLFVDDDAIPDNNWINNIVKKFNNEDQRLAAIGGEVEDYYDESIQFKNGYISKWGEVFPINSMPQDFNKSEGFYFNTVMGTNCAFRRGCLVKINGFDEKIEYYHEESDVCVRLIKAGYRVESIDNARVRHKYAPNKYRDNKKRYLNVSKIIENKIYFAIKHTKSSVSLVKRLIIPLKFLLLIYNENVKLTKSKKEVLYIISSIIIGSFRGYTKSLSLL
jgi:hypothetical protein